VIHSQEADHSAWQDGPSIISILQVPSSSSSANPQTPYIFFSQSSRENGWTVTRPDGTWIDGRDKGLNAAIFTGLATRNGSGSSSHVCDVSWLASEWNSMQPCPHTPLNPLAMGHLINHPPRDFPPNAAFHSIQVPSDIMATPALRWFVPCVRYVSPEQKLQMERDGSVCEETLPGLGVISTRDIEEGEEIFCNYNFDVDFAPNWYSQVTAG
jgi:hypothetical protein